MNAPTYPARVAPVLIEPGVELKLTLWPWMVLALFMQRRHVTLPSIVKMVNYGERGLAGRAGEDVSF